MNFQKAVVWSTAQCVRCKQAKELLTRYGISFEERVIGREYTKEDLLKVVPTAKTVPQIFLDGEFVGDYNTLCNRLNYAN